MVKTGLYLVHVSCAAEFDVKKEIGNMARFYGKEILSPGGKLDLIEN